MTKDGKFPKFPHDGSNKHSVRSKIMSRSYDKIDAKNKLQFFCRRRFDFQSPSRMDRNVEMFMQIEKALAQNKCFVPHAIFLRPDMDKILVPKLKDIIKRHQGHLVDNIDDATHIIHPPTATNDDGMQCLMPFSIRDILKFSTKIDQNLRGKISKCTIYSGFWLILQKNGWDLCWNEKEVWCFTGTTHRTGTNRLSLPSMTIRSWKFFLFL